MGASIVPNPWQLTVHKVLHRAATVATDAGQSILPNGACQVIVAPTKLSPGL